MSTIVTLNLVEMEEYVMMLLLDILANVLQDTQVIKTIKFIHS